MNLSALSRAARSPAILRRFSNFIFHYHGVRTLFCDKSLKLDHFKRRRLLLQSMLDPNQDFRGTLLDKLSNIESSTEARQSMEKFTELLYLADKDNLDGIKKYLKLLSGFKSDFEGEGILHIGAIVIRLLHYLQEPDEALSVFTDRELSFGFNDDTTQCILTMDLLYKFKQYDQVLTVFDQFDKINISVATLVLGACYHQNTAESFDKSQKIVKSYMEVAGLSKRAIHFAMYLALNQGKPATAFETLMLIKKRDNMTNNMILMCLAQLGDIQRLFEALKKIVIKAKEEVYRPLEVRLFSDTLSIIRQAVKQDGSDHDYESLTELEQELRAYGVLSVQVTTALLNRTIVDVTIS